MRAWELRDVGFENLVAVERPEPEPRPGEVLLRMRAAALNARDLQIVLGYYPTSRRPLVPLCDGVGEVVGLGDGVTRVGIGERVAVVIAPRWVSGPRTHENWAETVGAELDGTLRAQMTVAAEGVVRVPEHLSDEEAAAIPAAGVTAWHAVVRVGKVKPGDNVLVQGTGGVALFAVQFAKLAGARVLVTSRSAAKLERARTAGADETIDTGATPEWELLVLELTGGAGVDQIVELTGQLEQSLGCLRIGGVLSQIGYMASMRVEADVIPLMLTNVRLHGLVAGSREMHEEMLHAVGLHGLRPTLDQAFSFDEASEALQYMARGEYSGKIALRF